MKRKLEPKSDVELKSGQLVLALLEIGELAGAGVEIKLGGLHKHQMFGKPVELGDFVLTVHRAPKSPLTD